MFGVPPLRECFTLFNKKISENFTAFWILIIATPATPEKLMISLLKTEFIYVMSSIFEKKKLMLIFPYIIIILYIIITESDKNAHFSSTLRDI